MINYLNMISRVIFCLLFFASFGLAEDLEFRGFRKNELVAIADIQYESISLYPFKNEISTEYFLCKILEVTPTHLKVKIYYQATFPKYATQSEEVEIKKNLRIRRNTVSSLNRASIDEIQGWGNNYDLPKPGPFDLW